MADSYCEIIRKNETDYNSGTTHISKYVDHSLSETVNTIDAYLNSRHISGEFDSLGREKPFFNIVVAASNIWMRATDIDRKNIKLRATKSKDYLDTFMATVLLQDWMRRAKTGVYLNDWGRTLARYGSAITKKVKNDSGLHLDVISWNRMICDAVDFDANPKIEPIELTEGQLYDRIKTHGYNADQVKALMESITTRENTDKSPKDTKTGYIRLYEIHGNLSLATLKQAKGEAVMEGDNRIYTQQMAVTATVNTKVGRKTTYEDFALYAGTEDDDPYRIDHLIKEDGRTIARGAVENLFQTQWMENHAVKTEKDTLDLASRLIFQTSDPNFLNINVLDNVETGDVLIHTANMPLTQLNNGKYDITSMMNFRNTWKQLGNEINGVSEAMLGIMPPAGTPASLVQTQMQDNYSLFELMVENKGLAIEEMMREWILPYLKTKMDTTKEVTAILEAHDIARIDAIYFKNEAIKRTNKQIMTEINDNLDRIARNEAVRPIDAAGMYAQHTQSLQDSMKLMGNLRSFKPSELDDKTWADQFADLEWEVEVDITGENADTRSMYDSLFKTLQIIMNPQFEENKRAQAVVGKMLELTSVMSPIEYNSIPAVSSPAMPPATPVATPTMTPTSPAFAG